MTVPGRSDAHPATGAVAARVAAALAGRREELVDLLERLVAIETPSDAPTTHAPLLDLVAERLAGAGFALHRAEGVASGGWLAGRRERDRVDAAPQLLLGHVDTVWPVGTSAERPVVRTDDRLAGPGAYDMKAGIVQAVFALEAIAELDVPLPVPPVVLVNTDEEVGSRESSGAITTLARHADRVLVLEPSLGPVGRLKTARKGVGRFVVTVHGAAAHAGLDPDAGASAILELSHVIQELFALNDPAAGTSVNVGTVDGGLRANVVAPTSRAVVDVRAGTVEAADRVTAAIHGLAPTTPGTRIEVEGGFGRPPMERTTGTDELWLLARAAADGLGVDLEEGVAGGGSDGNTTAPLAPTLDGLGAVGDGAHAAHEWVALDRMVERTAILAALVSAPRLGASRPEPLPADGVPGLLDRLPRPSGDDGGRLPHDQGART